MENSIAPPTTSALSYILPREPLLLMGSGPVPIPYPVSIANSMVINHLGETMNKVIKGVKEMSKYVFQTQSDKILGISGPSSAAMEMAITNLLWPGRKALILNIGTFSGRLGEMAHGVGADITELEGTIHQPITVSMVEEAFKKQRYDVVTMAQGETSCGMVTNNIPEIAAVAKKHGAQVIIDTVCTLSTMPFKMDEWQIDSSFTGGQKGLSSIPGVSLIAFSSEAWNIIENRPTRRPHWCFDALRAQQFWGHQQYHYTAPVPGVLAIHEALRLICEETLEKRFERHYLSSIALQNSIEVMGLELLVSKENRLNSVVAIKVPKGINKEKVLKYMTDEFNVEISGAFGMDIVRVGQMGEQCRSHNLFKVLYALGMSFKHEGADLNISAGMAELERDIEIDSNNFIN